MDQLQVNATYPNIPPENLEEFKKLAAEAVAVTRGEEETLRFDFFLSDDGTKCVLNEAYASSDALLAHMGNMGELLGRLVERGGALEVVVLGEPSEQLLEAAAAFEPMIYAHLEGK